MVLPKFLESRAAGTGENLRGEGRLSGLLCVKATAVLGGTRYYI